MKRQYLNRISLNKNSRGVYCLDTSVGCSSGMAAESGGCYGECYAAKAAKLYGYDFSKTVLRRFDGPRHAESTVRRINKINSEFVRIGCSGDPSEDWSHCIGIMRQIRNCNREIVIITRHWTQLTDGQLEELSGYNLCINTSVSALDTQERMGISLSQHARIGRYVKAVLRVVSADFNTGSPEGLRLSETQRRLFREQGTLDTVLRVGRSNRLIKDAVILVTKTNFMGKQVLASKVNRKTFMGKCANCAEQCGIHTQTETPAYSSRPGINRQLQLLK